METVTVTLASKKEPHIQVRKRRAYSDFEFFLGSNMLVRWVASVPRHSYWSAPQKLGLVNFRLITSSWLIFNCLSLPHQVVPLTAQKTRVVSFPLPGISSRNICFRSTRTCVHDLRTISFPESFLITTRALACLFGDPLLCFFLFIYLFDFNFIWAALLHYNYYFQSLAEAGICFYNGCSTCKYHNENSCVY